MFSDILEIGNKIDIVKNEPPKEGEKKKQYVSQLLDFMEEDKVLIAMPLENGRIVPLEVDRSYKLCFSSSKGLFECTGVILERFRQDNLFLLVVQLRSELVKYQRRQFYRLSCLIDIKYRVVIPEEVKLLAKKKEDQFGSEEDRVECSKNLNHLQSQWYPASLTDLSGGGARFHSMHLNQPADKIRIDITFHIGIQKIHYELKANVISSNWLLEQQNQFESRVEFSEITEKQRETIIKFVFEEERKLRKREKGLI